MMARQRQAATVACIHCSPRTATASAARRQCSPGGRSVCSLAVNTSEASRSNGSLVSPMARGCSCDVLTLRPASCLPAGWPNSRSRSVSLCVAPGSLLRQRAGMNDRRSLTIPVTVNRTLVNLTPVNRTLVNLTPVRTAGGRARQRCSPRCVRLVQLSPRSLKVNGGTVALTYQTGPAAGNGRSPAAAAVERFHSYEATLLVHGTSTATSAHEADIFHFSRNVQ